MADDEIRKRIFDRVRPYFQPLIPTVCKKLRTEKGYTSYERDLYEYLIQDFLDTLSLLYNQSEFLQEDLNDETKQYFGDKLVDEIFELYPHLASYDTEKSRTDGWFPMTPRKAIGQLAMVIGPQFIAAAEEYASKFKTPSPSESFLDDSSSLPSSSQLDEATSMPSSSQFDDNQSMSSSSHFDETHFMPSTSQLGENLKISSAPQRSSSPAGKSSPAAKEKNSSQNGSNQSNISILQLNMERMLAKAKKKEEEKRLPEWLKDEFDEEVESTENNDQDNDEALPADDSSNILPNDLKGTDADESIPADKESIEIEMQDGDVESFTDLFKSGKFRVLKSTPILPDDDRDVDYEGEIEDICAQFSFAAEQRRLMYEARQSSMPIESSSDEVDQESQAQMPTASETGEEVSELTFPNDDASDAEFHDSLDSLVDEGDVTENGVVQAENCDLDESMEVDVLPPDLVIPILPVLVTSEPSTSETNSKPQDESTEKSSSEDKVDRKSKSRRISDSDGDDISEENSHVENEDNDEGPSGPKRVRLSKPTESTDSSLENNKKDEDLQGGYDQELMSEQGEKEPTKEPLILDFDPETNDPIVEVDKNFLQYLKPHQCEGVKFMFDRAVGSVADLNSPTSHGSGGILAHCMGLGKTLQAVCFVHTLMTHPLLKAKFHRVLIIAPANVIINWCDEFRKWIIPGKMETVEIHEISEVPTDKRLSCLQDWHEKGGVLLITQTLFVILMGNKKDNKKEDGRGKKNGVKTRQVEYLTKPDLVMIDEAHQLKNEKSSFNRCVSQIETQRRIALTGTPLQNNLGEYYVMVNFVKPRLLGTKKEFSTCFETPINHGMLFDSADNEVKVMKKRVHILTRLLKDVTNRHDYRVLVPYLTPKKEYVLKIRLTDEQVEMYQSYLEHVSTVDRGQLFKDYTILGYIWNHPLLVTNSVDNETDDSDSDETDDSDRDESDMDDIDNSSHRSSSSVLDDEVSDDSGHSGDYSVKKADWARPYLNDDDDIEAKIGRSAKFMILIDILNRCEQIGDKIIVFSQSLNTLNLIEDILRELMEKAFEDDPSLEGRAYEDVRRNNPGKASNFWEKNSDFLRIDGKTNVDQRMKNIKQFNDLDNIRARLMLVSTKAGGVGINLIGANRCILFDTSWNPANDLQAIFRTYRFGQKKPVYIYRFVSCGTMEQKVYERQILKQSLSHRVVDDKQVGRHFTKRDVQVLNKLHSDYEEMRVIPKVPDDLLLAEVYDPNKEHIIEILEHDSLLENRPEEDLSEAEREEAWKDFQNKNGEDSRPSQFYSNFGSDYGGVFLGARNDQQQQQLTYSHFRSHRDDRELALPGSQFGHELAAFTVDVQRQVLKQSLSHRVVDEKQVGRHFSQQKLRELYQFRSDYEEMRVFPKVPEDLLLAEVHLQHQEHIIEILENDSLLENRPEEDLSEAEREDAWKEYQRKESRELSNGASNDQKQQNDHYDDDDDCIGMYSQQHRPTKISPGSSSSSSASSLASSSSSTSKKYHYSQLSTKRPVTPYTQSHKGVNSSKPDPFSMNKLRHELIHLDSSVPEVINLDDE